jgi:hypothetical protein
LIEARFFANIDEKVHFRMWFDGTNYRVKMVLTLAIFRQLFALKGLWKVFENRQKKSLKVFDFFWSWRLRTLPCVFTQTSFSDRWLEKMARGKMAPEKMIGAEKWQQKELRKIHILHSRFQFGIWLRMFFFTSECLFQRYKQTFEVASKANWNRE